MANTTNIDYNYNPDNVIKKTLYKFYIIEELINFVETNIVINVLFRLYNSKDEKFKKNKESEIIQTLQKYGSKLEVKLNKIGEYFDEIEFMNRELIIEIFQKYTESIKEEIDTLKNKKKENNEENGVEEKKEETVVEEKKEDEINEEMDDENIDLFYNINNSLYNYEDKWKELIIRIIQTHFIEHILKLVTLHDVDSTNYIIIKVNLLSSDVNESDDNSERMNILKRLNINLEKLISFKLSGIFNTKDDTTNNEGLTTGIENMFGKIKIPNFTLNLFKDNNKETDRIKELKELLEEMQKLDTYQDGGSFLGLKNIKSNLSSLLSKGLSKGLNIFKNSKSGYYEGNRLDLMEDFVRNGPLKHKYIDITSDFKYNSKLFLNLKPDLKPESDAKPEPESKLFPILDVEDPTISKKVYIKLEEVQANDKKLAILKNIKADLELKEENEINEEIIADTSNKIKSLELPIPPTYIIEEKYVHRNPVDNMSDISLLDKYDLIISEQKEEITNLKKVMDENTKKIQKENEENLIEAANLLLEELIKSDKINDDIKNEFINLKNKIKTLEQDKSELIDTINKSNDNANKNNDNTRKLEDINSQLLEENKILQKQLEQILGQNLATDVVSNILRQGISKKTNETYEEKIAELYNLIEKLQTENKNRSLNEEKMENENRSLNEEKEQLKEKFHSLEQQKNELESQLTLTQQEIKTKEDELNTSKAKLETTQEEKNKLQENIKNQEEELEAKLNELKDKNNALTENINQKENQFGLVSEDNNAKDITINELRKQIEDNNNKIVILDNQYKSDTSLIKRQQQKIKELNDSLAKLTSEKDQVEAELDAKRAEEEKENERIRQEKERKHQEKQREDAALLIQKKYEDYTNSPKYVLQKLKNEAINNINEYIETMNVFNSLILSLFMLTPTKNQSEKDYNFIGKNTIMDKLLLNEIGDIRQKMKNVDKYFETFISIKLFLTEEKIINYQLLSTKKFSFGFDNDSEQNAEFLEEKQTNKSITLIFPNLKNFVFNDIITRMNSICKLLNGEQYKKNSSNTIKKLINICNKLNTFFDQPTLSTSIASIDTNKLKTLFTKTKKSITDYFKKSLEINDNMIFETKTVKNTSAKTSTKEKKNKIEKKYTLPTLPEKKPEEGKNIIVSHINALETGDEKLFKKNKICIADQTLQYAYKLINKFIKTYCNTTLSNDPINITNYHDKNGANKEYCVFLKTPLIVEYIRTGIDKKNNQNYNDNNCEKHIEEILNAFNNKFVEQPYTPMKPNDPKITELVETELPQHVSPEGSITNTDNNNNNNLPKYNALPTNLNSVFDSSPKTGGKKKTRRKGRTKKKTKTRKK